MPNYPLEVKTHIYLVLFFHFLQFFSTNNAFLSELIEKAPTPVHMLKNKLQKLQSILPKNAIRTDLDYIAIYLLTRFLKIKSLSAR